MSTSPLELDELQYSRVDQIEDRLLDGDDDALDELFLSERVHEEIDEDKIVLHSFNIDQILSYLPFSSRIYVNVCPGCINKNNAPAFLTLLRTAAIVPALSAPYSLFPPQIVEETSIRDHISYYEYNLHRGIYAGNEGSARVCGHCVRKRETSIKRMLTRRPELGFGDDDVDWVVSNLHPFIDPDFNLLDDLKEAVRKRNSDVAFSIKEISDVVHKIRTCEAFNSPLVIESADYRDLPQGLSDSLDGAIDHSKVLEKQIGDGLGLRIPRDIPLEQYVEIASDFRPRLSKITSRIASKADSGAPLELQREIMKINGEVERISQSHRYILMKACVEFYQKNSVILNAAFVAGALGMTNGLAGCVGGAATAIGTIAKQKGWVGAGEAGGRLGRVVQSAVQPSLDSLVAKYVGASDLSVSVLSLSDQLNDAAGKANRSA